MRRVGSIITALATFLFLVGVALGVALGWPLDAMNTTINQTNFIVNDGCSGTLISVRLRLILSNHHCVVGRIQTIEVDEEQPDGTVRKVRRERREEVSVSQNSYKGHTRAGTAQYMTEIVAYQKRVDLALLQMRSEVIPYTVSTKLRPADRPLLRGERVYVVGNPAGMDATVVEGVLSNLNRWVEWEANQRVPYIQFSGGIAGGSSGGALYDNDGFLIGVPGAMNTAGNHLGLAVPIDAIREFLSEACYGSVWDPTADDAKCRTLKKEKAEKSKKGE